MAYLVKGDVNSARQSLAGVNEDFLGPYVKVQQSALRSLCTALEGGDLTDDIEKLKQAKKACPKFSLEASPLRFLEKGLGCCMQENLNLAWHQIFDLIRTSSPEGSS